MKYDSSTDDPKTRKQAHGNPMDWSQRSFQLKNKHEIGKRI